MKRIYNEVEKAKLEDDGSQRALLRKKEEPCYLIYVERSQFVLIKVSTHQVTTKPDSKRRRPQPGTCHSGPDPLS